MKKVPYLDLIILAFTLVVLVFVAPRALETDAPLAVVTSWSMEPTLHVGDLIVVKGTHEPEIGDVVVYVKPNGELIVHRLIEIRHTLAGVEYITKGDANAWPDPPVYPNQLKGKVILVVPYIGVLRLFFEKIIQQF
ncbi:MAG: signal peptidase I [Thermofilaceae archaeon]|nr:signal peptidase I [Thermofilaceae archaeon]MDW8003655.1 signal peptidase I [Thermofilaceae archaeon]